MSTLEVHRADGVVTATMNRPEVRNALDHRLFEELRALFTEVAERADDRVVILTGAGGAFSSGGDLNPPEPLGVDTLTAIRRYGATTQAIHDCPKPVIAAVQGVAAGAGASLAMACDLVVASDTARIGLLFVRRGLGLDCGASWLLPRLVGMHAALEIALLGEWVGADDALRLGLVNRVVPAAQVMDTATDLAGRLAALLPGALAAIKRSLWGAAQIDLATALEAEAHTQAARSADPEFLAALAAFRRD